MRDLAWLLLSDDLLDAGAFPAALGHAGGDSHRAIAAQLLALDAAPEPLARFLAGGERTRLGRYAERLLHFFLDQDHQHQLLAAGLQVRDARRGGMTLGECDFLLRRHADAALLHWELAVKLYLYVPPAQAASALTERALQFHWLGPNLADSLADKVERLLDHQLRLTTIDAARSVLPAPGPWLPQAYLKGWLFHPLGEASRVPVMIAPGHGRGWWAGMDTWWAWASGAVNGSAAEAWAVLPRVRWLAPARVAADEALTLPALHARIESLWADMEARGGMAEPLLIVALRRAGDSLDAAGRVSADADVAPAGEWHERDRGFVVPQGWRERAVRRIDELSARARVRDAARLAIAPAPAE
ncbi:hypothetical protein PTE30175_03360 [Pandoraea terrae]|uniref:DUF1853 domain-containing protein n=1 Tax=Pandoraea terrae TaxID=1537710 RepID=A0A5E4WQG9_9BURK|nr:hypothetical protein PTE30175_03360 [Pandoraea terrae]